MPQALPSPYPHFVPPTPPLPPKMFLQQLIIKKFDQVLSLKFADRIMFPGGVQKQLTFPAERANNFAAHP